MMKYARIPRSHDTWKKNPCCECLKRTEERRKKAIRKRPKIQKERNKEPKKEKD
jgi:hypothetical protein